MDVHPWFQFSGPRPNFWTGYGDQEYHWTSPTKPTPEKPAIPLHREWALVLISEGWKVFRGPGCDAEAKSFLKSKGVPLVVGRKDAPQKITVRRTGIMDGK